MCANLFVYIISILFYACIFTLSVYDINDNSCKMVLISALIYCGSQVTFLMRIVTSCYMNLRYSRPFEECKMQFVMFFSNNADTRNLSINLKDA